MKKLVFTKVVIAGVGLIGGSFALALRNKNTAVEMVGFDHSEDTLKQAIELKVIDRIGRDMDTEINDADLVLLATPVGQIAKLLADIAPHLGEHTLIMDVGSTKNNVVVAARKYLGDRIAQFIPAHPIAGSEKSGVGVANANLFNNCNVILTPLSENDAESVMLVRRIWESYGAKVSELTPQQHDEVFAAVSHLPHLLSFALVHDIAQRSNRELLLSFAASGFRDFTRIAASSPKMWRDICMANREALLEELGLYMRELESLHEALAEADAERLELVFRTARELRIGWTAQ